MNENIMIFPEVNQKEFDFNTLKKDNSMSLIIGIPVKIDRIYKDITNTTVVAISGTFVVKGVKIRGVWNPIGNIMEFKRTFSLLTSSKYDWDSLLGNATKDMFQLVHCEEL